jgi:hypothetical protein
MTRVWQSCGRVYTHKDTDGSSDYRLHKKTNLLTYLMQGQQTDALLMIRKRMCLGTLKVECSGQLRRHP